MAGNGVRIRLKFLDAGILTKAQIDQGLAQCWHLVRFDEVRTISEVASDISSVFNLGESCPSGLDLEVDGFALPQSQPAHLLKDSDLVRIRRRKEVVNRQAAEVPKVGTDDQQFIFNRRRYVGYGGLELRAIDEFEKETGGYKSEEEEGEMETDISLNSGKRLLEVHKFTPLLLKEVESSGKKRKRVKDTGTEAEKKKINPSSGLGNLDTKKERSKSKPVRGPAGVNLLAADGFEGGVGGFQSEGEEEEEDGFEGELGGYESEEEEEEETDISLDGTKAVVPFDVGQCSSQKEGRRRAKKQKDSHKELDLTRTDNNELAVDDLDEQQEASKKNRKKKGSKVNLHQPTEDTLVEAVPVTSKVKEPSKLARKAEAVQNEKDARNVQEGSSRKKRSRGKSNDNSFFPSIGNNSSMDLECTLMDSDIEDGKQRTEGVTAKGERGNFTTPVKVKDPESAPPEENRPSRSARRKKAKRKWLREQQAKEQQAKDQQDKPKAAKKLTEGDSVKSAGVSYVKEVMEVETVDELQPVVVRAGHIRFESYEEGDDAGDTPRPSLPVINLGEQFKSKRQGQNWGQEKSAQKQKGKRWSKDSDNEEGREDNGHKNKSDRSKDRDQNVDLEKLPSLQGVPQDGDVVAYRLVELTTSWTPELSPFRVGMVVFVDSKMNGVKLAPHPDYPFRLTKHAELDDGSVQASEAYPLPYDEDGILETELSALVDLRLLETRRRSSGDKSEQPLGQDGEDNEKASREDGPSTIAALAETGGSTGSFGTDKEQIQNQTKPVVGRDQTVEELICTKDTDEKEETQRKAESSLDWQTSLMKELQRKKLEIRHNSVNAEKDGQPGNMTSVKNRKSKYLKSAGVGSIIARLRAEQAL